MASTVFTATCTKCETESTNIYQEFTKIIFDAAYQGKEVQLAFKQRKYKRKNQFCSLKYFMEELTFVDAYTTNCKSVLKKSFEFATEKT